MPTPEALLTRLDALGQALAATPGALGLLALGSVGLDTARLDAYSDLDFFVIVAEGHKAHYLHDLSWLAAPAPVAYAFLNTVDGYKALYHDGIFCEFAVFEPTELAHIPYAPGRWVWRHADLPATLATPARPATTATSPTVEWQLGEALTNLYVGLSRLARGETLSATRFIQNYALDRVIALAEQVYPVTSVSADPFTPDRRLEQRYPALVDLLPTFTPGYHHNRAAARAMLAWLEAHFEVNPAMASEIRHRTAHDDPTTADM